MARKSPLDETDNAAFAWRRWRRMMTLMAGVTVLTVVAALAWLSATGTALSIHFYVATALGIAATMLLTAALMGLVFLSNGTGHDDAAGD